MDRWTHAEQQLQRDGFAVVENVVANDLVRAARDELDRVAAAERADGTAILENGSAADGIYRPGVNQRVVALLGKSEVFRRLAMMPQVVNVGRRLFASAYGASVDTIVDTPLGDVLLASMTANIALRGGERMALHTDQGFTPPLSFAVILNVVWPLVDFTADNGATLVVPGSHLTTPAASPDPRDAIPVLAPAGSAILVDGRTWHGTGANRTNSPRPALLVNYCPPWIRPYANHLLDLPREDIAAAPEELLVLLGARPWFAHGHSENAHVTRLTTEPATPSDRSTQ